MKLYGVEYKYHETLRKENREIRTYKLGKDYFYIYMIDGIIEEMDKWTCYDNHSYQELLKSKGWY